jgi:hypothetical protein
MTGATECDFYLFDEEDKVAKEDRKRNNLFYLSEDSIVGGPSIIFNRNLRPTDRLVGLGSMRCWTGRGGGSST